MKNYVKKISKYKPSNLQGTLHLEVARPRPSLATEHPLERRALSILFITLIALVLGYLYFVSASIFNVMARTEAAHQTDAIQSSISQLEAKYLALSVGVSPQAGAKLGLAPIANTSYVYRPGNAALASAKVGAI